MLDAAELALTIVAHTDDIETALTQYEAAMFPRAKAAADMSAQGLDMCFSPHAPRESRQLLHEHGHTRRRRRITCIVISPGQRQAAQTFQASQSSLTSARGTMETTLSKR